MRFDSSNALSRTRVSCVEICGCCCAPSMRGLCARRASVSARSESGSGTSCRGSSWSSSANTRCSGYSSGLPVRRASSCAAATASWAFSVSLLKSMSLPSFRVSLLAIQHQVAAIFLVHLLDLVAHLLLQLLDLCVRAAQLVLEPQHELDAREVEAELRRQPLDDLQPVDVRLGVDARSARRAFRPHETPVLVGAQRLRMHVGELRGDTDHVHRAVVHQPPTFFSSSSSSRSFLFIRFGTWMRTRASTSPLPEPSSFGAPRPLMRSSFPS